MAKPTVLTLTEAANHLRTEREDVRQAIDAGDLHAINVGGKTRIPISSWEAYLGIQSRKRWRKPVAALCIAALVVAGSAASLEFPFPIYDGEEIPPQAVEFTDPAAEMPSDPERYALVNAPLDYRRYNEAPNPEGTGFTHMLMSLQQQNIVPPDSRSYPWTLYVNLDTNHDKGDGVASHLRLHSRGSGWTAASHADAFAWGDGPTLGNNIETMNMSGEAYTVGMNIQNKAFRANAAVQVQTGPYPEGHRYYQPGMDGSWETGIRLAGQPGFGYYETGIELDSHTRGVRGIWMRGDFAIGLDMGGNDIKMKAGSKLTLAGAEGIAMRFNQDSRRIEFLENGSVIAFLDVDQRGTNLSE